jgi:hypothetical protein
MSDSGVHTGIDTIAVGVDGAHPESPTVIINTRTQPKIIKPLLSKNDKPLVICPPFRSICEKD